jgi:hypothetical protein
VRILKPVVLLLADVVFCIPLAWQIAMDPGENGSSEHTGPRFSFISPTNQVSCFLSLAPKLF